MTNPNGSVLEEAARIVKESRLADYGHPIDNWSNTAAAWTATLRAAGVLRDGAEVTAELAVLCMVQMKCIREAYRPKRDNRTDIGGYDLVLDLIHDERQRRAGGHAHDTSALEPSGG